MLPRYLSILILMLTVWISSTPATDAQNLPRAFSPGHLLVEGNVVQSLDLSPQDLTGLPRQSVGARDHTGTEVTFEGVSLRDVLRLAGVPQGEALRGNHLTTYILVEAADGYRVVFALAELDPAFHDRLVMLADRQNGQAIPEKDGPLRLVIPDEKRQARWVRQVIRVIVRQP